MKLEPAYIPIVVALIALAGVLLTIAGNFALKWFEVRVLPMGPKPATSAEKKVAREFWTEQVGEYGWLHRAHPDQKEHRTRTLLVFIHGILGNSRTYWGDTPKKILEASGEELDAFSYGYNAGFWKEGSAQAAAQGLDMALIRHLKPYHEYVFITHSAGGLVLKTFLRNQTHAQVTKVESEPAGEKWELRSPPAGREFSYAKLPLAFGRLRAIVFAAVPHFGATGELWRKMDRAYRIFHCCTKPLKRVLRFLSQGGVPGGWCEFPSLLKPGSPTLAALHGHFLEGLAAAKAREQGVVQVLDVRGLYDGAAPPLPPEFPAVVEHLPHTLIESLPAHVAPLLQRNPPTPSLVARATVERSLDLDAYSGVVALFPQAQQPVLDEFLSRAFGPPAGPPELLLLSGPAGTGKSVILRRLARTLALSYWAKAEDGASPLPLVMPLQQVDLLPTEVARFAQSGAEAWALLSGYWMGWGRRLAARHGVAPEEIFTYEWMEQQLKERPSVLIFDSVDEFLVNHPDISARAFLECLLHIQRSYRGNQALAVCAGIRDEHTAVRTLRRLSNSAQQLARPELEELCAQMGVDVATVLQAVPASLIEEIRRPVLFRHVVEAIREGSARGAAASKELRTEGQLCETALRHLLRSRPIPKGVGRDDLLSEDEQLDLLAMIAWCFYGHSQSGSGALRKADVVGIAREKLAKWGVQHSTRNNEASSAAVVALTRAAEPLLCERYLNSSVFFPVDAEAYRFIHNLWQDFLMGRYLALCMNAGFYRELGEVAYKQAVMKLGAHFVGEMRITADAVAEVIAAQRDSDRELVFANYCAFVAVNPAATLELDGLRALLDHLWALESPPLRLVDCVALVYRVVYVEQSALKDALQNILLQFFRDATDRPPKEDPIFRSLAFCFRGMMAPEDVAGQQANLPRIAAEALPTQLLGLCHFVKDKATLRTSERTLQSAFVQVTRLLWQQPVESRAIASMHYCYYLVLCSSTRGAGFDVETELAAWFRTDGPQALKPLLEQHTRRPEVLALHEHCRQLLHTGGALERMKVVTE